MKHNVDIKTMNKMKEECNAESMAVEALWWIIIKYVYENESNKADRKVIEHLQLKNEKEN